MLPDNHPEDEYNPPYGALISSSLQEQVNAQMKALRRAWFLHDNSKLPQELRELFPDVDNTFKKGSMIPMKDVLELGYWLFGRQDIVDLTHHPLHNAANVAVSLEIAQGLTKQGDMAKAEEFVTAADAILKRSLQENNERNRARQPFSE